MDTTGPSGIGGWLALLAAGLCIGLAVNVAEFFMGFPDVALGWSINPSARVPLAIAIVVSAAYLAVNIWALISLFQKKKVFRRAFFALWMLAILAPLSALGMLSVPGITVDMLVSPSDIGRAASGIVGMGLWNWYVAASVRVRNTLAK